MKKKIVRGNNAPFMNKTLSKAFMHRAKLKNRYYKEPTEENKTSFKKHRNYCVSLLRKEKRKYYNSLDEKIFEDNRKFWKRIKPLFSDKVKLKTNITLVEDGKSITDNGEVAEILNSYFIEAVENLEIERFNPSEKIVQSDDTDDVINSIIKKYESHPSILKIKENVKVENKFEFKDITEDDMYSKIRSLDPKKASIENDIPAKILIGTNDIISPYLSKIYNESKNSGNFPKSLKTADVTPIHKDKEKVSKKL